MAGEVVQPVGIGVVTCLGEMRAPVANPFDYGSLDTEHADAARSAAQRIRSRAQAAIIDTGRDLVAIKTLIGHGQFGRWLGAEFGMSVRTAQDYMRAATLHDAKYATVAHLPPTVVLQIARAPARVQDHVLERLASGEIGAGLVRPTLRARVRKLRLGSKVGPGRAKPSPTQAPGSYDGDPSLHADAEALLAATGPGPDADEPRSAICRALRLGLERPVMPPASTTSSLPWQDLRDAAVWSPTITRAQPVSLATLGARRGPTEAQIARLHHIVRIPR